MLNSFKYAYEVDVNILNDKLNNELVFAVHL